MLGLLYHLRLGAGSAFPSIVALVPLAANVDTRTVLKGILESCADCDIRYSSLGNVLLLSLLYIGWSVAACDDCVNQA